MRDVTNANFGLLIAFVVPGLTALWGASHYSVTLQGYLAASPADLPTVGGFLYLTIGSVTAGLVVSTIRWAVIDTLHHWTGVQPPRWNFRQLPQSLPAFDRLIDIHYRYYQFYANMLVATIFAYVCARVAGTAGPAGLAEAAVMLLTAIFFAGSRDTLQKYYRRSEELLGRARRS